VAERPVQGAKIDQFLVAERILKHFQGWDNDEELKEMQKESYK